MKTEVLEKVGFAEREGFSSYGGFHEPEEVELIVYPDAHPEVSSVDGHVRYSNIFNPLFWADLVAADGNSSNDSDAIIAGVRFYASTTQDKWTILNRAILLFDTSAIPDGAAIISATLSIYGQYKIDGLGVAPDINVYSSDPASDTELANDDYGSLGSTPFCDTPITYDNFSTTGYNDFVLNAAGLAAITKGGITKLGIRNANYDVAISAPAWSSGESSSFRFYGADKGGDYRPKLTITYRP